MTPRIDKLDRNLIQNGAMFHWQRGTSFNLTASPTYGFTAVLAERFKFSQYCNTNSQNFSLGLVNDSPVDPSAYGANQCYAVTSNQAHSFGGNDFVGPIRQLIEGYTINGISVSQKVYGSFWMKSSATGVTPVTLVLQDSSNNYMSCVKFVNYNVADTWQRISFDFQLPGFNFYKGNDWGMQILVGMIGGASSGPEHLYASSLDTWLSGFYETYPGAMNWATNGGYFKITAFKLSGHEHTGFSHAGSDLHEEAMILKRYFELITGALGAAENASTITTSFPFSVRKRTTPSMGVTQGGTGGRVNFSNGGYNQVQSSASHTGGATEYGGYMQFGAFSGATTYGCYLMNVYATGVYLTADAEM